MHKVLKKLVKNNVLETYKSEGAPRAFYIKGKVSQSDFGYLRDKLDSLLEYLGLQMLADYNIKQKGTHFKIKAIKKERKK